MPAQSGKQYRWLQGIAHGSINGGSMTPSKASEWIDATPPAQRSAFSKKPKFGGKSSPKAKAKTKIPFAKGF